MGEKLHASEIAVPNPSTGEIEVISLETGEVIVSTAAPLSESYTFNHAQALMVIQAVREGRTLVDIGKDPTMPGAHVIAYWQRRDRMFAEELSVARRDRAEVYHDRAMNLADKAGRGSYGKEEVPGIKLAIDTYKWGAERGNPNRYSSKVIHEGNEEKPILMRVINTGINRQPRDVPTEAVITGEDDEQKRNTLQQTDGLSIPGQTGGGELGGEAPVGEDEEDYGDGDG